MAEGLKRDSRYPSIAPAQFTHASPRLDWRFTAGREICASLLRSDAALAVPQRSNECPCTCRGAVIGLEALRNILLQILL